MGHIAGCYLGADIFARFHRMLGNDVLMVSGSDSHGTPITVRAEQEGIDPEDILNRFHPEFLDSWKQLGISFDLFTTTHTKNHEEVVQQIFTDLLAKDYIYKADMLLAYCSKCDRFLPDRYVEGRCPNCSNLQARGDQCELCGRTLDPQELISPECILCHTEPEFRVSEHFFLRLSAFEQPLLEWIRQQKHWRPNVANSSQSFLETGLKDRAITRDLSWGIPIPVEGFEDKRIYVWFEAVIGYLSAAIEWSNGQPQTDAWSKFWTNPDTRSYYFIGKDNIPFHSIIWPAILMAYGHDLNLPYDVPANEFLSLENRKFSTSQNWALWVPDYLQQYDPDPLRYMLTMNMPETGDSDFSWGEFVRRNNDELVSTYGNLVNRILSFTYRNFEGLVPNPGQLDERDIALLDFASQTLKRVTGHLKDVHIRPAMIAAFGLAQETNRYLDSQAPWKSIKEDRIKAGTTLWVGINVLNYLKILLSPFLPFSSQQVHEYLGLEGRCDEETWPESWSHTVIQGGSPMTQPSPLYKKLESEVFESQSTNLDEAGT
jgi:methionyl-tRNA synthetase